jgi:putative flippase GtrA
MEKLKRELPKFIVAGFFTVFTDASIYYILLNYFQHDIAKAISFICGTLVAFVINKYWTFQQVKYYHKEMASFFILYGIAFLVNVGMNGFIVFIGGTFLIAYLFATGISATLNFLGQKFLVFRNN